MRFADNEDSYITQRQVALLTENAPPMTGPRMQPTPQLKPVKALYKGASVFVVKVAEYVRALYIVSALFGFVPR